ncbi:MAG TPA: BMP family protein [Leptolinea sp.]
MKRILYGLIVVSFLMTLTGCAAPAAPAAPTEAPKEQATQAEVVKPTEAQVEPTKPAEQKPTEPVKEEKPFRVAMTLIGAVNDKSWNESGYNGLLKIEKELGAKIAYQERIPLTDAEESLRTFASQGYDLVIGHGDEFSEAGKVVAPEFPNVKFAVVNGANIDKNLTSISMFDEQLTYLVGVIAAKTTKSKKVGFIGGLEIPPVVRNGNGMKMGIESVDPKIQLVTTYLGDFNDAAKGKAAAEAMIEQGVDVIYYYVDQAMLGIQEAAKAKKVKLIGCIFDQHELAPDLILTSAIQDTPTAIFLAAKAAKEGTLEGKQYLYGLDSGALILAPYYDKVPADVQKAVEDAKKGIIDGSIKVPRTES